MNIDVLKDRYYEWAFELKDKYGLWTSVAIMQRVLNEFIFSVSGKVPNPDMIKVALLSEVGEVLDEIECEWKWWKGGNCSVDRERLLEELVDVLHFYMSLVVYDFIVDEIKVWDESAWGFYNVGEFECANVLDTILDFVNSVTDGGLIDDVVDYDFGVIMKCFGFSYDDVWSKFVDKSFENYVRQVGNGRYGKVDVGVLVEFANKWWVV